MPSDPTQAERAAAERERRDLPGLAWGAWLVACGILVWLTVNVVRHLGAAPGTHMPASDALFRSRGHAITGPLLSHRLITVWQLDAVALAVLVLAAAWYVTNLVRLRRRRPDLAWSPVYSLSFLAGLAVSGYATCGAIAVYDQALFTAHMLGHLALVMLAPALLVVGRPMRLAVEVARPATRARIKRVLHSPVVSLITAPPVALATYTATIVGSHLTGLMDTIMVHTWAGQVEHVVYLVVGYQFFALVVGDEPIRWRLSTPARWALLAVSMAVDTFTGVVLMMSTRPITMNPPPSLSVDTLSDTRTGGAIMWFGGDGIMAVVMIALVVAWLRTSGRAARDSTGWLERARVQTLSERTGAARPEDTRDFDDADEGHAAYNAWLASIARDDPARRRG